MRKDKNEANKEEEEGEEEEEEYINYQYVLRTSHIINIKHLVSILVLIGYIFRGAESAPPPVADMSFQRPWQLGLNEHGPAVIWN